MSYEKIHEPVEVMVAFRKERPEPMMFKWGARYFQIQKVNLVHAERVGREKVYYFSVSDEANAYRLSFRTESLQWQLEELCPS
jgi:hypothetical protein